MYLVVYCEKVMYCSSNSNNTRYVELEKLEDISTLNIETIYGIYEYTRKVPFALKHEEEIKVVQHKPYYEVEGVKIPQPTNTLSGSHILSLGMGLIGPGGRI